MSLLSIMTTVPSTDSSFPSYIVDPSLRKPIDYLFILPELNIKEKKELFGKWNDVKSFEIEKMSTSMTEERVQKMINRISKVSYNEVNGNEVDTKGSTLCGPDMPPLDQLH